jgi:hypothetical protein
MFAYEADATARPAVCSKTASKSRSQNSLKSWVSALSIDFLKTTGGQVRRNWPTRFHHSSGQPAAFEAISCGLCRLGSWKLPDGQARGSLGPKAPAPWALQLPFGQPEAGVLTSSVPPPR